MEPFCHLSACLFPSHFPAFSFFRSFPGPRRIGLSVPSIVFWQLLPPFIYLFICLFIHYTKATQYNIDIKAIDVTKVLKNTKEVKITPAKTSLLMSYFSICIQSLRGRP